MLSRLLSRLEVLPLLHCDPIGPDPDIIAEALKYLGIDIPKHISKRNLNIPAGGFGRGKLVFDPRDPAKDAIISRGPFVTVEFADLIGGDTNFLIPDVLPGEVCAEHAAAPSARARASRRRMIMGWVLGLSVVRRSSDASGLRVLRGRSTAMCRK